MSQPTVLIESLIKRAGGSTIPMGDKVYRFQPDEAGRHVATVSDSDHIANFLRITEGYRLLAAVAAPVAPQTAAPVGVTTPTPVPLAPAPAPATDPTAPVTEPQQTAEDTTTKALDQLSDEELRGVFKAELGRVAPPKSKIETMIAQIEAIRAERAAAQ